MKPILIALIAAACCTHLHCQHMAASNPQQQPTYQQHITFAVDGVAPQRDTLPTTGYRELLHSTFVESITLSAKYEHEADSGFMPPQRRLEGFSRDRRPMTGVKTNGFFETVHLAYASHRPLVITPDMVWLTIAQGFSRHINQNSEAMRQYLVHQEGIKTLDVNITGRVRLGDENSDWEWTFRQFHDSIAANTQPAMAELIAGRFSGTGSDAAVAFDITLMDAMKTYFDYWGSIMCGIPEITLEGTPDDWRQVEQRAAQLARYDLDWWVQDLKPILAEFTLAAEGKANVSFWKSIVKDINEPICGGDTYITGWIARFYPYLKIDEKYARNPILGLTTDDLFRYVSKKTARKLESTYWKKIKKQPAPPVAIYSICEGENYRTVQYIGPKVTTDQIPSGISTAILNVDDNGTFHKMELKAGFMGYRQDSSTMALRPVIGWAVIETGEQPDPEAVARRKAQTGH